MTSSSVARFSKLQLVLKPEHGELVRAFVREASLAEAVAGRARRRAASPGFGGAVASAAAASAAAPESVAAESAAAPEPLVPTSSGGTGSAPASPSGSD